MPNTAVDVNSWAVSACYPRSTFYLMSDNPSIRDYRITKTNFRSCSTYGSRSQAHFYLYALRLIADQAECTYCTPPLLFGRRPPQSNCPTETVHVQDSLHVLETKQAQGGISRMAQRKLAPPFRSLPPILHKTYLVPISACSKGSWGLSV